MSSNCAHCGAPLVPTARFCTSCGTPNPHWVDPTATRANDRLRQEPGEASAPPQDAAPAAPAAPAPPTAPFPAAPYGQPDSGVPAAPYAPPTAPFPEVPPTPAPAQYSQPSSAAPYGQPQYEQPPYGQPQHEQPPYGQPYAQPDHAQLDHGQYPAQTSAPKKSKKGLIALIGGLVLLLAAGGFGGWWFFLREDDSSTSGGGSSKDQWSSVTAIAEAPEQAWSWDANGVEGITSTGDNLVVYGDDGVRLFGADDQPLWSTDEISRLHWIDDTDQSIRWGSTSDDDTVLVNYADGTTIKKLDGWDYYWAAGAGRAIVVQRDGDEYDSPLTAAKVVDNAGNDLLELPLFDAIDVHGDDLYLAQHEGKLLKFSLADKKEVWSVDIASWDVGDSGSDSSDSGSTPPFRASMTLLESSNTLMVMAEEKKIEVRKPEDGSVAKTLDVQCTAVYEAAPSMVACPEPYQTPDYSSDDYDPDATSPRKTYFYDANGELGSITSEDTVSYYSAFTNGTGDDLTWYLKGHDGVIYDATFQEVSKFTASSEYGSPVFQPTDTGLYLLRDGKLELTDIKGTAAWSLDIPVSDEDEAGEGYLAATDDLVAVLKGGKLTAWKR